MDRRLNQTGNFKAGDPLEQTGTVLTGKDKVLTDGPYAEAKDVVGGYLIVSANSQDQAIKLSRRCPIFEVGGSVEVRQIIPM